MEIPEEVKEILSVLNKYKDIKILHTKDNRYIAVRKGKKLLISLYYFI